ncbi:MAG: metalloregulator ArsR/SmtB family transcription factor [Polyangiaceae bacterium]
MVASATELDAAFAALADPTRRAIVARLARGEATVMELAAPFTITQPAVTKHLGVLERAGLIERARDGQRRPCRLRAERLRDVSAWVDRYRAMLEETYARLDDYLEELQQQPDRKNASDAAVPEASRNETEPHRRKEHRHGRAQARNLRRR